MNIIRQNKALCLNGTALVTIGRILGELETLGPRMKSRKYSLKHGFAMHEHRHELVEQKSRNFAADYGMGERKLSEADYSGVEARLMAHYAEDGKEDGYGMNFARGDNYDS